MPAKRTILLSLGLAVALVVCLNAAPAAAIKSCTECTCMDSCTLVCYVYPRFFEVCDGYLCVDHPDCQEVASTAAGLESLDETPTYQCSVDDEAETAAEQDAPSKDTE